MEPARKRRISPVWEHFDLISPNKVRCLLCSKELGYNNNTSSMLRHFRALHENKEETRASSSQATRKQELDEALVSMIVKDTQPFSIVEDVGFRAFVSKLDPNYVIPTRQALKAMVEAKCESAKEKAKAKVEKAFPQSHTAENIARVKASLMEEWGITNKVTCMVTDGAPNMVACVRELKLRHHICIAHTLNLIVKKALDQNPVFSGIRAKARKLVGFFRSSTTAKEKLTQVQLHLGMAKLKLMQEVETRWNSTYLMLQRLVELREPVGAALAGLQHDMPMITSDEFSIVGGCLSLLSPFYDATVELSAEENVSASKVVPLMKMLEQNLQEEIAKPAPAVALEMGEQLIRQLREKLYTLQSMSIMSLATLLDPRFKVIGFFSQTKATEAIKRLTSECATIVRAQQSREEIPQASTSHDVTGGSKLWRRLDTSVMEARRSQNVTADATVEVQRYLSEPNIGRLENPLEYWERQKLLYPNLHKLALAFLCTPASSVPCERVFSKAGEVGSATGLVVGQAGVGNKGWNRRVVRQAGGRQPGLDRWVVRQAGVGNEGWTGGSSGRQGSATRAGQVGRQAGRGRQQGLDRQGSATGLVVGQAGVGNKGWNRRVVRQAGGRQPGLDRWVVRQAGVGNEGWTGGSSGRQGSATRAGQVGRQAGRGRQQGLDRWVVRQAGVGNKGWNRGGRQAGRDRQQGLEQA
ncbi:Zinc finger BED domain-containing protein 1 [Merluccius polli]|uniref:Zinc finger BED domain-containing protein 1 n=1 Tax=Merluccius polli TaxID=89951 RepID=A0AA47NW00_MERPO|nr:Zinc finger BED domain-containing protein 1 [Merluccius polli]